MFRAASLGALFWALTAVSGDECKGDKNADLAAIMGDDEYNCDVAMDDYGGLSICENNLFIPYCCYTCTKCGTYGKPSKEADGFECKCDSLAKVQSKICPGKYYNPADVVAHAGGGNFVATSHKTFSAVKPKTNRRRLQSVDDGTLQAMCDEIVGDMSSAAPDGSTTVTYCSIGSSDEDPGDMSSDASKPTKSVTTRPRSGRRGGRRGRSRSGRRRRLEAAEGGCGHFGHASEEAEFFSCKCNSLAQVENETCPGKYYNPADLSPTKGLYVQSVTKPKTYKPKKRRRMAAECSLVNQISKAACTEGETWGCDMEKNELWATEGCRGKFSYDDVEFGCGEGQGESNIYRCELPIKDPAAMLPGKLSEEVKTAIKKALVGSITDSAEERGLEASVGSIVENEAITKFCGFPAMKIKMRVEDRTKIFKNVEDSCACEAICTGEDAWLYHMERQICHCRAKTEVEKENRATRNDNWMSSYTLDE